MMASGPITSWQIDGETMETLRDFIWGDSKTTADDDYSHEIRRCLLLGMKAMTNLLLLLSRFSRVWLCATPETAAHHAPPSLGFSRQEHWSGLPFPSPMHESEKWKWSRSVVSDSSRLHGLQPTRLLHPWDFPGKRSPSLPFLFEPKALQSSFHNPLWSWFNSILAHSFF